MPDYKLKSLILSDHPEWIQMVRNERKFDYLSSDVSWVKGNDRDVLEKRLDDLSNDWFLASALYDSAPDLYLECNKIIDADKQRKKRLRKRIERIMSKGKAYFVTLTFSDDTLSSTDVKTRRTYVTRFIKDRSPDFVGNVDYGKLNGREHYHFVMCSDRLDDIKYIYTRKYGWICSDCPQFAEWSENGFYSIKSCGNEKVDQQKLSWYISKLTNHSIKETTKRSALIFSR